MTIRTTLGGQTETLEAGSELLVFRPSEEQRSLKAAFYARISDNPTIDPTQVGLVDLKRILKRGSALDKHWSQPGFQEWFRNQSEHREKLEELFDLALDAARDILLSTEPKVQGARVQMIKAVAELANKYPKKEATNPMLAAIGGMDRASLEVFLHKQGVSLQVSAQGSNAPASIPAEIIESK